jgi:hypothetical protein
VDSTILDIQSKSHAPWSDKMMAQQLTVYVKMEFQHLLTDNESWIAYDYTLSWIWTMMQSDIDPIPWRVNHPWKIMLLSIMPEWSRKQWQNTTSVDLIAQSTHQMSYSVTFSFWLPAQENDQVRVQDDGRVRREDQGHCPNHPEVAINYSFRE